MAKEKKDKITLPPAPPPDPLWKERIRRRPVVLPDKRRDERRRPAREKPVLPEEEP